LVDGATPESSDLRAGVAAAVDYGLAALDHGNESSPSVPKRLLAQARRAADRSIGLDTVLRRHFAVHALLADILVRETGSGDFAEGPTLQGLTVILSTTFDRLIAEVSGEYSRKILRRHASSEKARREGVENLLAGEVVDAPDLSYDFDAHHVGIVATGPGAGDAIRSSATRLGLAVLVAEVLEGTVWAWLGSRGELDSAALGSALSSDHPPEVRMAVGEPAPALAGWRLTHRQAKAALSVALRGPDPVVRYAEVAMLAAILRDDLLATSLRRLYLAPLEGERDGGEALRRTLRGYFDADRNASLAAGALGISRQAVARRVRAAEQRIGRSIESCGLELEAALRFEALDATSRSGT
jgi:hypothetical protein